MTSSRYPILRVAIVGLGPSGAYAAGHLLANAELDVRVDAFERLPTPWGLARAGVAPDHPRIKSVTRVWETTAQDARFAMYGNVELGRHISREDLLARYHAVIYAVGTPAGRPMSIPGEDLPGSVAATSFVGWYNGHPDHRDDVYDLSCRRAVVVGNGNVAVDVARILTLSPGELARTDIADHALEALRASRIREIVIVGRRGPEQATFTSREVKELGQLSEADVVVDPAEVAIPEDFREQHPARMAQRNLRLLEQYAARAAPGSQRRRIALRFLLSPTRIIGDDRVEAIELVRNRLERQPGGGLKALATDAHATVPTGLVLRAIGYRGRPLSGVPFDERRGLIANEHGRVIGGDHSPTREYVVGWAKRGPSGVIGTNKRCALETVRALLQDMVAGRLAAPIHHDPAIEAFIRSRQRDLVTYRDWVTIDRHEIDAGEPQGRPRVKLTRVAEMVAVSRRAQRLTA